MNSDNLILRQNSYSPLTNKGAVLTSDDFDNNFINIYKDIEALKVTNSVDTYNALTVYDDATVLFATYSGRLWQWVNASPGSGVTPANGLYWQEVFPSIMAHRKNSDTILDEGGANEISAADIVAGLAVADATTDLTITSQTPTSLQLNSSTGADVVFLEATQDIAGLLSAADKIKLVNTTGLNTGDQTLGGLNGEDLDNKATDFLTVNHTLYPSVEAVDTHVQTFSNSKLDHTLTANQTVELATYDIDFVNGNVIINSAYTLPNVDGTTGQVIQTDGAGALTWETLPADANLGSSDLTQSATGVRSFTLAGDAATDLLRLKNDSSAAIVDFRGDGSYFQKNIGVNVAPASTVGLYMDVTSLNTGINIFGNAGVGMSIAASTNNGQAIATTSTGTGAPTGIQSSMTSNASTSKTSFKSVITGTAPVNTGISLDVTGGTSNVALDIIAGKVKTGTGETSWDVGGSLSTDKLSIEGGGVDVVKFQGDGDVNLYDSASVNYVSFDQSQQTINSAIHAVGNIGNSAQYALKVYSRLASSSGVAQFYNSSGSSIFDFRQAAGSGTLGVKNAAGTQQVYLNGSSGYVEAANNFRVNGVTGLGAAAGTTYTFGGGGSGDVASMTFNGGILTAVTTVP